MGADDQSFFFRYVIAEETSPERLAAKITRSSPHSHRRIAKAYDRVRELVFELADVGGIQGLERWDSFIRHRAKIIPLLVSDDLTAFQIFETLNDRGVELATADLLKNYLFRLAGEKRSEEAKTLWTRAAGRIASESRETIVSMLQSCIRMLICGSHWERTVRRLSGVCLSCGLSNTSHCSSRVSTCSTSTKLKSCAGC